MTNEVVQHCTLSFIIKIDQTVSYFLFADKMSMHTTLLGTFIFIKIGHLLSQLRVRDTILLPKIYYLQSHQALCQIPFDFYFNYIHPC